MIIAIDSIQSLDLIRCTAGWQLLLRPHQSICYLLYQAPKNRARGKEKKKQLANSNWQLAKYRSARPRYGPRPQEPNPTIMARPSVKQSLPRIYADARGFWFAFVLANCCWPIAVEMLGVLPPKIRVHFAEIRGKNSWFCVVGQLLIAIG
jgi:hypothetical protein